MELDAKNEESETVFEGLSELDRGQYTVEEEAVAEYTSSLTKDEKSSTYTFTNIAAGASMKHNFRRS